MCTAWERGQLRRRKTWRRNFTYDIQKGYKLRCSKWRNASPLRGIASLLFKKHQDDAQPWRGLQRSYSSAKRMPLAYKTLCFEPIQGFKFRNSITVLALQKAGEVSMKRCETETSNGSLVPKIQTKGRIKIKFWTQIPVYIELYLQNVTAIGALKNGSEIWILNQSTSLQQK